MSWLQGKRNGEHASVVTRRPAARSEDLVLQDVDGELLVYDRFNNSAHCLNATAAQVFRACDGYTSIQVMGNQLNLDEINVEQALFELENCGLLQDEPQLGHTRREMAVKFAKYGTAASLPFIVSTLGPVAMAAATPTPAQCLSYSTGDCNDCTQICGCCCCCQGCSGLASSCKVCYPTSLCAAKYTGANCATTINNAKGCSSGPNCSATSTAGSCSQPGVPCVSKTKVPCGCATA